MLFSSVTFLYYFLPITLLIYFVVPKNWKNAILFLASFLFYFWGEPKYCILMAVSIFLGYFGGLLIGKMQYQTSLQGTRENADRNNREKFVTAIAVLLLLSFLAVFKYADFSISTINGITGSNLSLLKLALPIGISFYTFQIVSYLIDVYRKDVEVEKNFINFAAYVVMFPQLIAGPIVRFQTVQAELRERTLSIDKTAKGIERFVVGLAKKVLIADLLGEFVLVMDSVPKSSAVLLWITALAYAMQIYFDFSGYSDMAIGLGLMLGFHFPENFDYPYVSKSITEFWRRWHMTLGGWFRDYVYIPLGGSRVSFFKWLRNVFVVWFLSGLWHGASWNFVLWGIYFGVLLALEKLFLKKRLMKLPKILQHIYAIVLVVISFVIFRIENLGEAFAYLAGMFGFGLEKVQAADGISLGVYQVQNYGVVILAAVIIALGIPKQIFLWLEERLSGNLSDTCRRQMKAVIKWIQPVYYLVLLLVVTAFLIQSSVHPFLYFRF